MAEFIRTSGISHYIESIIVNAKKELYLVTPYLQLSPNFYERLSDANRNDITINLIFGKNQLNRKEEQQVNSLENLRLHFFENLHAKCYFNEKEMVITSMNLYEFSEKNNREMGVYLNANQDSDLYQDARKETDSIIQNSQIIKDLSLSKAKTIETIPVTKKNKNSRKSNYQKVQLPANGVCIRCHSNLPLNLARPMCYSCFTSWRQFENPTYPENHCHICSKNDNISMNTPVCYGCYKKHETEIKEKYGAAEM